MSTRATGAVCGYSLDTIYALSSGTLPAAIAVVRISGGKASAALSALCGVLPSPRRASLRLLRNPVMGQILDSALILWFPGRNTATGEDLAELHLHGSRAVVAAVEQALATIEGLRRAEAGEFTRRAFLNGRIDLAQAEGLADLLAAETETQRVQALTSASGHLSRKVEDWQQKIMSLSARIEAILNFADEGDVEEKVLARDLVERIGKLANELQQWLARPAAERIHDGLMVVIAGPPNAGKSTLINALAQRETSIVSPIAGTTRDIVEVPLSLDGIAMRFADTAGLCSNSDDAIEAIGIERAHKALAIADILLWLGEAAEAPEHDCRLIIAAQADRRLNESGWPEICDVADLVISATTGEGMNRLHHAIVACARSLLPREGEAALHHRQRKALAEAANWLAPGLVPGLPDSRADSRMDSRMDESGDLLLLAERLRLASRALDLITGRAGVEDMLDALFGRFCIGK